jgi:predicted AAA+ superfamily ATPase
MSQLLDRNVLPRLRELLTAFRIVILEGARQTGKTTLAAELLGLPARAQFSFDDPATLARAVADPVGFVDALPQPAVVDEFQRAGGSFLLAVKQAADRDRSRGQLLLTGSANYLADRRLSETLAGRAGRLNMWPLSMGERIGRRETFIDRLFEPGAWPPSATGMRRDKLVQLVLQGGYPEVVTEGLDGRRRRDWFEAYVHDVVSREALRPMVEVRFESELRKILRLLAARTTCELVVSDVAADAEVSRATTENYVTLLSALHLVTLIPAFSTNATTRAKRHAKIVLADTGLAADLCGTGEASFALTADGKRSGALFETFVIGEVLKQASWSEHPVDVSHFRDRNGAEVDLVVENRQTGRIAGLEIKLTSTPLASHVRHLAGLRDRFAERFTVGLLVHAGTQTLPLGDRLWAVPVTSVWEI